MSLPPVPSGPPALDGLLLYRLSRVLSVAGSMVTRLCEGRFGITRREWRLIATLASHGPQSSSQLAEHAQLDRARTSRAVGSLVGKQLISRDSVGGDRRQVLLELTASGRALYEALYPLAAQINSDLLSVLDPAQRRTLDQALQTLQARAEQMVLARDPELPRADRRRRRE